MVWFLFCAPATAQGTIHHNVNLALDFIKNTLIVTDTISVGGHGRHGRQDFVLSPEFKVSHLTVDGIDQTPQRKGHILTFDLGPAKPHTIVITTQGLNVLDPEGNAFDGPWLAHPQHRLATWEITGSMTGGGKWLTGGKLSGENDHQGRYQATFQQFRPSPLPVLITGPYTIRDKMLGDISVRTYFHDELEPFSKPYLDRAISSIKDFHNQIGPYPYSKFSIVSAQSPVGYGLPGMTYLGRRVIPYPFILNSSLPHEVLHNWWGNGVEADTATGNWAEGLTSLQTDHDLSEDSALKRREWLRNFAALPRHEDTAIDQFTHKTHDTSQVIGYDKTAFVFHMLRLRLSPQVFNAGLRLFAQRNVYKTASWADLQQAFEETSKQDLSAFFKAWVTRPGAPSLELSNVVVRQNQVTFTLAQTGNYSLTIPIELQTKEGALIKQLQLDDQQQSYTLTASSPILGLNIDPHADVFRRLSPREVPPILRHITLNPNTQLILPGNHPAVNAQARQLAAALLQRPISESTTDLPRPDFSIVAGLESDVRTYLGDLDVPDTDAHAQVRRIPGGQPGGQTILIITAKTLTAFQSFARVLNHYKRRSYISFHGGKVVDKGTWKVTFSPLSRKFSGS